MWTLLVKEIDSEERVVAISRGMNWRIGRHNSCEVRVDDLFISGEHAAISEEPDGAALTVKLTRGTNPILFQGQPLPAAALRDGDCFVIGKTHFTVKASLPRAKPEARPVLEPSGTRLVDAVAVLQASAIPPRLDNAVLSKNPSAGERVLQSVGATPGAQNPAHVTTVLKALPEKNSSLRLLEHLAHLAEPMPDLPALQTRVLEIGCRRVDATRAFLAQVENAEHQLNILATLGFSNDVPVQNLISTTVLGQLMNDRQAVLIGDTADRNHGLDMQASVMGNQIKAVACVPILDERGDMSHVLYLDNQERSGEFSVHEAEFLIWLGHVYRLLADNLLMRKKLEAEIDRLQRAAGESGAAIKPTTPDA